MKKFREYVEKELGRFNTLYAQRVSSFYAITEDRGYTDEIFEDFEYLRHLYRTANFDINEHLFRGMSELGLSEDRQCEIRLCFNAMHEILSSFDELITSFCYYYSPTPIDRIKGVSWQS